MLLLLQKQKTTNEEEIDYSTIVEIIRSDSAQFILGVLITATSYVKYLFVLSKGQTIHQNFKDYDHILSIISIKFEDIFQLLSIN